MSLLQLNIPQIEDAQIKDLLIGILSDNGFEGFEETATGLFAYIDNSTFSEDKVDVLKEYNLSYSTELLEDQNWNAVWESSFEPVTVDDFVCVRANFHEQNKQVEHDILITPKMSFGTGHHATTYLMMQQMRQIDFKNKSVFDFGTGTGVLAILAEKLGAATILGVDNDDWSIDNAKENLASNHCEKIQIVKGDNANVETAFDIILANINRNIILQNIPALYKGLKSDGVLLLSGLLREDEETITKALLANNFKVKQVVSRNEWICIAVSR